MYSENYGISTLADALFWGWGSYSHQYWLTANQLNLDDDWKEALTSYIDGISHAGIGLRHGPDSLAWLHNKKSRKVTTQLAYDLVATCSLITHPDRTLLYI